MTDLTHDRADPDIGTSSDIRSPHGSGVVRSSIDAEDILPDAGRDLGRRFLHRILRQMRVARRRLHLRVPEQLAHHRQAFPERQRSGGKRASQVMQSNILKAHRLPHGRIHSHNRSVSLHRWTLRIAWEADASPLGTMMPSAREGPLPPPDIRHQSGSRPFHSLQRRYIIPPPLTPVPVAGMSEGFEPSMNGQPILRTCGTTSIHSTTSHQRRAQPASRKGTHHAISKAEHQKFPVD